MEIKSIRERLDEAVRSLQEVSAYCASREYIPDEDDKGFGKCVDCVFGNNAIECYAANKMSKGGDHGAPIDWEF